MSSHLLTSLSPGRLMDYELHYPISHSSPCMQRNWSTANCVHLRSTHCTCVQSSSLAMYHLAIKLFNHCKHASIVWVLIIPLDNVLVSHYVKYVLENITLSFTSLTDLLLLLLRPQLFLKLQPPLLLRLQHPLPNTSHFNCSCLGFLTCRDYS